MYGFKRNSGRKMPTLTQLCPWVKYEIHWHNLPIYYTIVFQ